MEKQSGYITGRESVWGGINGRPRKAQSKPHTVPRYCGTGNHNAKLTEHRVRQIRRRANRGELLTDIAATEGVTVGTVSKIVNWQTWQHAGGPKPAWWGVVR